MLRRSAVAFITCASVLAVASCGIKGPLRMPPGATAPAPTGAPPGAVPTEAPTAPTDSGTATMDPGKEKRQ